MKTINWSRIWPHAIVVVLFFLVTYLYFSPLLDGKRLESHDIRMYYGMAKELNDYRDKTGEEALWTNSMFGGMPSYLISTMYPSNLFLKFGEWNMMLNKPANYLILSLLGFYILLLVFGANPWLALAGALGFGFSTYFFIIEAAGHHTKALAMAYMPGIVAGVVAAYHGKRFFGAMLAAVFFALQLTANHLQITYYTGLILLLFLVFRVVKDVREKAISGFLKTTGVLAFALILGILPNITSLWLVYDYSKDSTRGKSELTSDAHNKTSGLDRDYVTDYSYEKKETFNLLIPNFLGGASATDVGLRSKSYEVLQQNGVQDAAQIVRNLPTYWGSQRSTSGPVYIGAFLIFLFVLGLFLVKGPEKWWLVAATSLAIVLAWGKNFGFLTNLFLDYFPLYNKFRTVTMILVIAEMCIPLLGFLALIRMAKGQVPKQEFFRAFKWALGIVGGICLLFALAPGLFLDFSSEMDAQLVSSGWPQWIIDALREDRASMLKADAFRSLAFIVAGAGLLLAFFFKKIPTWDFMPAFHSSS